MLLHHWFKENGFEGLENLIISNTIEGYGLGCFANKTFNVGDVLFKIPRESMISFENVIHSKICQAVVDIVKGNEYESLLTLELLIWIFICSERFSSFTTSPSFRPYLESLNKISPDIASWPKYLLDSLVGTNLAASHGLAQIRMADIEKLLEFIRAHLGDELFPNDVYNSTNILWARGHYLSRRYPGTFALGQSLVPTIYECFQQEKGLEELGAFVPLLDILNHKLIEDGKEWLDLKLTDTHLIVSTNFPINVGSEIFSNYGSKSNENYLYAYGFAIENNLNDTVAVKLMSASNQNSGITIRDEVGYFYITNGGMEGVPSELWNAISKYNADIDAATAAAAANDDDDGNDDGSTKLPPDHTDVEPIEISLDDIDLVLSYMVNKRDKLIASEASSEELLDLQNNAHHKINECHQSPNRKRKKSMIDIRTNYVRWYRAGQRKILDDLIRDLSDLVNKNDISDEESI